MSITLHQGSILDATTDTIVNPANSFLRHGGGLARVIANACAPDNRHNRLVRPTDPVTLAWEEEQRDHPNIATGDAGWTSAGALSERFKGIVHAVGPIYANGRFYERQLLASAHARAIAVAKEHGCESIAFPAISTGIFGYPIAEAAQIAVRQAAWFDFPIEFWLFSDDDYAAYEIALADLSPRLEVAVDPDDTVTIEPTCYCGKPNSVCVAENGSHCHHPDAAAHMWGDR